MTEVHSSTGPSSTDASGPVEGSIPSEESSSNENPDPNSAAQAVISAEANFRLQNFQFSNSEGMGLEKADKIGSLNAGDRYASNRINSQETAEAARRDISGRDSLSLHVGAASPPPPNVSVTPTPTAETPGSPASEPIATHRAESRTSHFSFFVDDDEWLITDSSPQIGGGSGRASPIAGTASESGSSLGSPSAQAVSSPPAQRYIFDVHDVHAMGGTRSSLSIRNEEGDVVRSIELPNGDSQYSVDLAPGEYTVEATSGSRAEGGVDALDNFRVDVYSTGPSPSGASDSGGNSGGGAGGDSAG
jgi:hypothetical protein